MRSFSAPNIRIALTPDSIETAAKRVIERPRSFKGLYSAASLVPKPDAGSAFDNALDAQRKVLRTKRTKQFRKVARRRYIRKKKKGEITREHEFYNLTYCMMIGIRYTVGRQRTPLRRSQSHPSEGPLKGIQLSVKTRDLNIDDFMHVDKIMFPPEGGKFPNPTPPHRLMSKFKFKDYSAQMFKSLRKHFNIKESDYMLSICGNFNFIEFISNSKSGQFFFYSHDGRYLIKTQSRAESKFLRRIFSAVLHAA